MTRALLIATLLTLTATAQTREPESAVNITVRLFSTQSVSSLTITPLSPNSTISTCPACVQKPIPTKLQIDTTTKPLTLEGTLRITAGPDKQITAAGHWQITPTPTGLKILLTLPSERYVIAALTGEAAPDEPPQSLRALAVAIRTFALTNLNRHHPEAFNLCDSTHCQALRFTTPRPEVEQAVRDTAGETLWFGSQPGSRRATIYYTQSCGGQTESASNLWPTEHEPYLTSHPDPYCIRRTPAAWHAQITLAELATIARQQNWHLPTTIESIRITKRTPTGRALTLELAGKGQTAQLSASSLHFALDRELGWNQLRSDWYTVTLANAALHFDGKGYGHGVGLCQTGAHEMATEGHTYREILAFYFPGTHTGITPTDQGWLETQHPNWTLLTTQPTPPLPQLIDQAWTKAQSLFPPRTPTHPTIQQLPTTELFRQTTSEPGWVRASTQSTQIYLQPPSILNQNGTTQNTLLHELLHALIEQESTDRAPLWLREGLAEALANPNPTNRSTNNYQLPTINSQLNTRTNQQQARAAQLEAAQKVHHLIEQYGIATVRTWLRTGIPSAAIPAHS